MTDRADNTPVAGTEAASSRIEGESTLSDRRPLFALMAANGVSQIGNNMTIIAGPWFVLQTTGSAAKTGIVAAALTIGGVIAAFLGGPLVDRVGFKRASLLADLGSAFTVGAIPALHLAGALEFWHLVVLVFLLSSLNSQGDTGRYAMVPDLARRAGMSIERANSIDRAGVRFGQVLGPFLGGVLITWIGATNVLFVDAATFTLSALLIALAVPSSILSRKPKAERGRRYASDLLEGWRFIRASGVLLSMIIVATVGNLLDKPLVAVIAPVYTRRVFGDPTSLGLVVGAFGLGAFAGSLLFGAVGGRWPRRATFLTCYVIGPLIIFGSLAVTPGLPALAGAMLVAGLVFGPVNPVAASVIQDHTPPEMLGRVFGALTAVAQAGIPIGAMLAGYAVQEVGLIPTIVGMGSTYVIVTLAMFFNPALKRMDAATSS